MITLLILYVAIGYLIFLTVVLGMNLRDFTPLLQDDEVTFPSNPPLVSICIPARNEEHVIKRAVTSALKQDYPSVEVLVLDDQSSDGTSTILKEIQYQYQENLLIIHGNLKPDNWLGKSWACHQLSNRARGDLLFFMDADAWIKPNTVTRTMASMHHFEIDFLTVWPVQVLGGFWEQVVIPLVYYGLLSLLPARYVHCDPAWLPSSLKKRFSPKFAAACGQCMAFNRNAYEEIGGHSAVKQKIVEDVALAKLIKQHDLRMRMFHGKDTVFCRMYTSGREMWQGFRKNFLALFNDSIPAFILMACINFIVFILPFIVFPVALVQGHNAQTLSSGIAVFMILLHRVLLARWFDWSKLMSFLHPLGVFWFLVLGIQVMKDHFSGKRVEWKDRAT